MKKYKFAAAIRINWLMFGNNKFKKEPDGLLVDNYTKCNKQTIFTL